MTNMLDSCMATIDKAKDELKKFKGWERRYADYACQILVNLDFIEKTSIMVDKNLDKCFTLHLTSSEARDSWDKVVFDAKYLGQNVARLICDGEVIKVSTNKRLEKNNAKHFGCEIALKDHTWDSEETKRFREHFMQSTGHPINNPELRLQGFLVEKLTKGGLYIQPVKLGKRGKAHFMMPSAIGASAGNIKDGKRKSAHIDLLTRAGIGFHSKLCVLELKQKYGKIEKTLNQGVAYATFLIELLTVKEYDCGANWSEIFGYPKGLAKPGVSLNVAIAMPNNTKGESDKSFAGEPISIGDNKITLHYLYFNEKENDVGDICTSLTKRCR